MIGIDIIKSSRMKSLIDKFEHKALQRFLSDAEIQLVKNHTSAAGFWAAKEAFSKALGTGIGSECSFFDIQIHKTKKGAPYFILSQKIVEKFNILDATLSITHDGEYAIAVVVIEVEKSTTTNKIKQF